MAEKLPELDPADVEAIVRKYLARMARRYMPLIGSLLVLAVLALALPSRSPTQVDSLGQTNDDGLTDDAGSFTDDGASTGGGGGGGNSAAGGSGGGTANGGGGGGGAITQPPPAGTKGIARSGVSCGPGVRQVKWIPYAPICTPRYTGNNGGNTYRGVTKDKIRGFYRMASSAQDSAINAALGEANLDDDLYLADMKAYMEFFNKQFELYGRQLEIVTYDAQGDYLQEHQGLDQGQAQADAQRAVDMKGFVDVTFPLKGSYPFWDALAKRKTITMGPTGFPNHWYKAREPYWYTVLPTGTGVASWLSMLTCRRMKAYTAEFAGDAVLKAKKRVFGLLHPENPEYDDIGDLIMSRMEACGAKPVRRLRYEINVGRMPEFAANYAAQLNTAGVTTVLCYCDPIYPIFQTNAAEGQNYHPEWWSPAWGESQGQQLPESQWSHAFVTGARYPKKSEDIAYKVYKMIKPNAEPESPYYALAFSVMLMLFDALQSAGPNLNPSTFMKGWTSMGAIKGPAGTLEWKPGNYSPVVSSPAAWWDPDRVSEFNGEPGSYVNCFNSKFLPFDPKRIAEYGTGQLPCFGK